MFSKNHVKLQVNFQKNRTLQKLSMRKKLVNLSSRRLEISLNKTSCSITKNSKNSPVPT